MKRRVGKIRIASDLIRNMDITEMLKVTNRFVVIRCEHLFLIDEFEYTAICPEFDEIDVGEILPTYMVELKSEVKQEGNFAEIVDVKFIRL